jgi:hypothetical protein
MRKIAGFLMAVLFVMPMFTGSAALGLPTKVGADIAGACSSDNQPEGSKVDLILLIDQSLSLTEQMASGIQKLKILKQALESARPLFERKNDQLRIGVITFNGNYEVIRSLNEQPFTKGTYSDFVAEVTRESSLKGGTNYRDSTTAVIEQFRQYSQAGDCRVVIWFTDGEVDLPNASEVEDGNQILEDFCGGSTTEPNKGQTLRSLNIRPFVVLLTDEEIKTDIQPDPVDAKGYRKWASIVALHGLTGDWISEDGKPLEQELACTDVPNDNFGDLIQASDVEELVTSITEFIIKGTLSPDFCPSKGEITSLPAGIFFQTIAISISDSSEFKLSEPALLSNNQKNLIVLDRSVPDEAKILDGLKNGWNIVPSDKSATLCMGYKLRASDELLIKAEPSETQIRIYSSGSATNETETRRSFTAKVIDFAGLDDSVKSMKSDTDQILVNPSDKYTLEIVPNGSASSLESFPSSLILLPDIAPKSSGEELLEKNPIRASLNLTNKVSVKGIEELPKISCLNSDGKTESLELEIKVKQAEVSSDRYLSEGSCGFTNLGIVKGDISVRFQENLDSIEGQDASIVDLQDQSFNEELNIENSTKGDSTRFTLGYEEAFPNKTIDYFDNGTIVVEWSNGGEKFIIGEVTISVDLGLLPRSNKIWAIIVAAICSLIALVIAYSFLFIIFRQTASVGNANSLKFLSSNATFSTTDLGESGRLSWVEQSSFIPEVKDIETCRGGRMGSSGEVIAGSLILRARIASYLRPDKVIRQAWTEVSTSEGRVRSIATGPKGWYTYSVKETQKSSTRSPLQPVVVVEIFGVEEQKKSYSGRVTFIVPNSGKGGGLNGIEGLRRSVVEVAETAVRRLVAETNSKKVRKTNSSLGKSDSNDESRPSVTAPEPVDRPTKNGPSSTSQGPIARPENPGRPTIDKQQNRDNERPPGSSPR